MLSPRDRLEPRSDDEPRYNPNNKTDRKIVTILSCACVFLVLVATACFLIYYLVFHKG